MRELDDVLENYNQTKAANKRVPGQNITPALMALRNDLPATLRQMLTACGVDPAAFYIKASAGQPNYSFPKVPWAAIFKKSVTKSAKHGYYIVLLFAEDMSSVTLSLNQGYTAFSKQYVAPKLAYAKLADCARAALQVLAPLPDHFHQGPIDLKTDGDLAKGYEAGAILSKTYTAGAIPARAVVEQDLKELLTCYLALAARHPVSLIDLDVSVSDHALLEAATSPTVANAPVQLTTGPQPRPLQSQLGMKTVFARSPTVLANALHAANTRCVLATVHEPHRTFMSARSGQPYVEGHHIIPFSQQAHFEFSLDVEENVAVLCPTCHRMLHHGAPSEKKAPLAALLAARKPALLSRGISVSLNDLLRMYKALDGDD